MIRFAVTARQGVALDGSQVVEFGPAGGTIGRAETNTLVLLDPDRTVSRVHAQVLFRGGQFFIVDRGSNPLQCNGVPLGSGREVALAGGERLTLGSFELRVELLAQAAQSHDQFAMPSAAPAATGLADDPFADLLAGLGGPNVPAPNPASTPAPKVVDPLAGAFPDPLGQSPASASASLAAPSHDPFADLLGGSAASAGSLMGDDFSGLGLPAAAQVGAGAARIDDLFGLGAAPASGGAKSDPLALSPLADPLLQPNTASSALDPLAAFGLAPAVAPAPRSDHVPIGRFGFTPPVALDAAAPRPPPAMAAAPVAASVLAAQSPSHATSSNSSELLAAFLRGVGPMQQPPVALTPALMERIGALLRTSAEGTLQLLQARQELKREVRAEVTMIGAQANNPLKFSPTAEVALSHLLGPGMRGFMPADVAMRDAFDDLRAHQFGVMVGLRAALAQLIERLEPDELEKKIAAKSALDALFTANRKARLWEQFVALYGAIAAEAEDDFHALFGKAFAEAYDEQMARLKQQSGNRSQS